MQIKEKYSASNKANLKQYLKLKFFSLQNSLLDPFVKKYSPESDFVFVVGCGHSGTTLLASLVSNHEYVYGVGRETYAFSPINNLLSCRMLIENFDFIAATSNKKAILEKTPKHVLLMDRIRKLLPDSKFLIITRNPLDNIASLYKRFGNLDDMIERWLVDNNAVLSSLESKNTHRIKYEDLVCSPDTVLKGVFEFLGYEFDSDVLDNTKSIYSHEFKNTDLFKSRKAQISAPITANINSWVKILSAEQADYIYEKTESLASLLGYGKSPTEMKV